MIKELWPGVSLNEFNNWNPLTGEIKETPEQYIKTWPDKENWFKTFSLRAQNDINAYLNDILRRFEFSSFKDKRIQETLIDMVFLCVEHWVYNRTPIEFNSDASLTFNNNQTQTNSFATPTINIWDLSPTRMKIWANFTQLKQIFESSEEGLVDPTLIDLDYFYTKTETDELLALKQDKLTAGENIKIENNVISATSVSEDEILWKKDMSGTIPIVILKNQNQTLSVPEAQLTHIDTDSIDATGVSNFKIATATEAPTEANDLTNKEYVDNNNLWETNAQGVLHSKIPSDIGLFSKKIINVSDPTEAQDAATKNYVDKNKTQLSDEEIKRLKLILAEQAFAYNKNAPGVPLEHVGQFTQKTTYNDLQKPEDNIVTTVAGDDLGIKKVNDIHYSGNTWFDSDGNTTLRDYQGALTYKGQPLTTINPNIEIWEPILAKGNDLVPGLTVTIENPQVGDRYKINVVGEVEDYTKLTGGGVVELIVSGTTGIFPCFAVDKSLVTGEVTSNGNFKISSDNKKLIFFGFNGDNPVTNPVILRCRRDYNIPTTFLPENKKVEKY